MFFRGNLFNHKAGTIMNQLKNNYILLSGAWHSSWCWRYITPILLSKGHSVITPDLPGHGNDTTAFSSITLKSYVDSISKIINSCDTPVTLVGHSMAGVIISQLADMMPDKIDRLIYVAAYIPENKGSLMTEAKQSKSPGISTEMIVDIDKCEIDLRKSQKVKEIFYNTCNEEDANDALLRLKKEPLLPFSEPITISKERFGKVKKLYIECLQDKAIQPDDQKRMYINSGCDVITLHDADHSPFFSTPDALANAILSNNLMKENTNKIVTKL